MVIVVDNVFLSSKFGKNVKLKCSHQKKKQTNKPNNNNNKKRN